MAIMENSNVIEILANSMTKTRPGKNARLMIVEFTIEAVTAATGIVIPVAPMRESSSSSSFPRRFIRVTIKALTVTRKHKSHFEIKMK